jgi:hypothetical protein
MAFLSGAVVLPPLEVREDARRPATGIQRG